MKRVVSISRAFIVVATLAAILCINSRPSLAIDTEANCQYAGSSPVSCSAYAYTQQTSVSVALTDTAVLAAGNNAQVILCNGAASGNVWLNLSGGTAVVGSGVILPFLQCRTFGPMSTGIHGIADTGASNVGITTGN